jgi:hypothetical protein
MHRPSSAALRLAPLLIVLCVTHPHARADAVDEARALIARDEPAAAVDRLETALLETPRDRLPALLEVLRSAYDLAATRAEATGKTSDAKHYREALKLLSVEVPKKKPPTEKEVLPEQTSPAEEMPEDRPKEKVAIPSAEVAPGELARGDAAWKARRYLDAGASYARLAKAGKLPPQRSDQWAYCRLVAVLERINGGPKSPPEWAEIHAEIDHIRLLSPKNWYSEYLRNVVVERSGGVRPADPSRLVVRGAAPEEPPPARSPKTRTVANPAPRTTIPPSLPSAPEEPVKEEAAAPVEIGRAGPSYGNWKTYVTANFQIFHNDEELARKVALRAESARRDSAKRWTGAEPKSLWTPKCDLYLYPTAAIFAQETQQPPESPGFSTAGLSGGRVTARLVKLRADNDKMLDAVLPHEVTHIILADLFPVQQIPRWADEGMSVLSEPEAEQALRARDLADPFRKDVLFHLDVLMKTDYPSGSYWALFYAQSVSLTRYLVGQGTPPQFIRFVKATQQTNIDTALRQHYKIDGVAELEARWKAHTRAALNPSTATNGAADGVTRR